MRILLLLSELAMGGAERVATSLGRHLVAVGAEVQLCTLTARFDGPLTEELSAAGVPRHDLRARRLADPRPPLRLARLLGRQRIDLVHAHGQDAGITAAVVRGFCRVPLVITRHVLDEPNGNWRQALRARLALNAIRRADAAVAVSHAAAERLSTLAGMPREAIRVIPNGIDLREFQDEDVEARGARLRAELGFGTDDRVVLVPAVFREGKGQALALSALPQLRQMVPRAYVVFAGGGDREVDLRSQAGSLGAAAVFLGPRNDIPLLLAACDLVVLPSDAEAFPTALMEAAAAGRAAVATRVGGTPEIVSDGCTGLLVPPGNPTALAEAMAGLLTDRNRCRAMGEKARRHAQEHFGIDGHVRQTLALWSEVLAMRA